jgi:hypothetical protein
MNETQTPGKELLTPEEEAKLHAFATAIAPGTRRRYHILRRRLEQECLTPEEQHELGEITEEIENVNVKRLEYVAELARRRNQSLAHMVRLLNIRPLVS